MTVAQLLAEAGRQVPGRAPVGTRWKATSVATTAQGSHQVTVAVRIDAHGRRREQLWCDGVRVERGALLRLTCAETECPHAVQVRAQWAAFLRRGAAPSRRERPPVPPWMVERALTVGRQRYMSRSASFPCHTPCPNGAHPPLTIAKQGFDLFDDSGCVGGGVVETDGVRRPRIPTLRAAEAFVLARHLEALAAMGAASDASRGARGPAPDAG